MSRMALEPTQQPGCEADHSPPSSVEVKECVELYLHFPQLAFVAWCWVKSEGQLYLYIIGMSILKSCTLHCFISQNFRTAI